MLTRTRKQTTLVIESIVFTSKIGTRTKENKYILLLWFCRHFYIGRWERERDYFSFTKSKQQTWLFLWGLSKKAYFLLWQPILRWHFFHVHANKHYVTSSEFSSSFQWVSQNESISHWKKLLFFLFCEIRFIAIAVLPPTQAIKRAFSL